MDEKLKTLVEAWCDRRCYKALRQILKSWPMSQKLTDDYANLLDSLKGIRAFAKEQVTSNEMELIDDLVREVEKLVYR